MADVQVIHTARLASKDPARLGKEDVLILYSVDGAGTRTLRLPAEDFTLDKAKAAIAKDLATHKALVGQKFTV